MRAGDRRFQDPRRSAGRRSSIKARRSTPPHQGTAANLWMNRSDMWKAPAGGMQEPSGPMFGGRYRPTSYRTLHYHPQRDPMQAF